MNKTAIKNFSIWARNKLISDIQFRAQLLGVLPDGIREPLPQSEKETQFFDIGTKDYAVVKGNDVYRRAAFVEALRAKARKTDYETAYKTVIEKIAYTWFNRLIAIRFMEVNDYLPGQVRVLSSRMAGKAEPDIVSTPFDSDLEFTSQEQDTIMQLKDDNKLDDLFRMLFISQCHKLSEILPGLFVPKENAIPPREYYELLLNINFTDQDGLVWHLVHDIPERDFRVRTREDDLRQAAEGIPEEEMPAGQVEIIGWLYQYYNTEPKNDVFAGLKKNKKIGADDIPAATQLFTPDWIVRYMVQNSLGRLWVEGHPDTKERFMPEHNADGSVCVQEGRWNYYLDEASQEPQVEAQLAAIREEYARLRPEDIRVIDPCCGSGHIAVYLFDVLMQIYETQGWTQREAAQSIVENNLYALDIDDRAAQLAYFAVMMKARQYDRRFFSRGLQPHVYAIPEWDEETHKEWSAELKNLCYQLQDGKDFGSIIDMPQMNWDALCGEVAEMSSEGQMSMESISETTQEKLRYLIDVGHTMAQKYNVVVTNPPYMGGRNMNASLLNKISNDYPEGKADLFSAFILRTIQMTAINGFQAMITMHSWMFLSSFEQLRNKVLYYNFINMNHLGSRAFEEISGEVVQTTTWTLRKALIPDYVAPYVRLLGFNSQEEKEQAFIEKKAKMFYIKQKQYDAIPGKAFGYWLENPDVFSQGELLEIVANPRQGLKTLNNDYYIRYWHEVSVNKILFNAPDSATAEASGRKWFPLNHGGEFRKYFGNNYTVVNWENDGADMKANAIRKYNCITRTITNIAYYFKEGITWSVLCSEPSFRWYGKGFIFSNGGQCIVPDANVDLYYITGLLNSKISGYLLNMLSPTMGFESGYLKKLPIIFSANGSFVSGLAKENIRLCKEEWDDYELSWDFSVHPLVIGEGKLSSRFEQWKQRSSERINRVVENDECMNEYFIKLYHLTHSLSPEVSKKDTSLRESNLSQDIKSLISYAVGCMFGRYSLDTGGLVYAGGAWNSNKYSSFIPDTDNCIPITDEPYFEDDIVGRFVEFIHTVYGADTLEENLTFIAKALGNKGNSSREVIRNYFLNDFMKDHIKAYQKCPIYWLFDSGKQNGFKALIYMHRWNADTVGNLRVEYLHRMQRVYEKEIERMQDTIDNSHDSREIARATKRREKLVKQLKEARDYDAKIAHVALSRVEIDLDDGVKVNYEKVQKGPDGKSLGILAKI